MYAPARQQTAQFHCPGTSVRRLRLGVTGAAYRSLMAQIPPALHSLLGSDLTQVTADDLKHLIGIEENQDLELKELVGDAKGDRREFAVDVTALANGGGGLLAVGITEDDTGAASEVLGIAADGDTALRFEQILASLVQPPLAMSVHRVPLTNERDVVLVAVEGGPLRPHAVLDGTSKLSYPVRRGRKKEYLTEAEVADSYARRFTSADRRAQDLADLQAEFTASLNLERQVWVAVSLLPSNLGFASMRPNLHVETKTWLGTLDLVSDSWWNTRIGYQSVQGADDLAYPNQRLSLRIDGAGAAAWGSLTYWMNETKSSLNPVEGEPQRFGDNVTNVLARIIDALTVLTSHARHAGATGSADVAVQLVTAPGCHSHLLGAGQRADSMRLHNLPTEIVGSTRTSRRTVDLSALPADPAALLQAATMLSLDLISEYGHSDLGIIDGQGQLRPEAPRITPALTRWAETVGVPAPR